jgi:hypothetical protein
VSSEWTARDMHALGTHHAQVETERDLEATMATLVEDPVYELWPVGLRMQGRDRVTRYYRHLMDRFMPAIVGYELLAEWCSEESLSQEYDIEVATDDGNETHRVIGILYREGTLMGGERLYASERCLRLMAGDELIDALPPMER